MGTSDGASSRDNRSDKDSAIADEDRKEEQDEDAHNDDEVTKSNQVLPMMNGIFSEIAHNITSKGKEKLDDLKKMHMIDDHEDDWEEKANLTPLDELVNDITRD